MEMGRRDWMSWEMGVFLEMCIAHAKISAEHIAHIAEELDIDRLVKAVLCIQGCTHIRRQLFIIEGRTGHQLHQDEQHQQNCQQRKQRGQDSLERIFFHVGWTPFFLPGSRGQSFFCRGQAQCQKGAQWLFAGHCAALFSDSVVYSLLVVFLYTRFRAQG